MKKRTFILIAFFYFLVGCQDKQIKVDLEKLQTQIKTEEQNKAIIQKVLKEGDNNNVAILEEVCSPDYKMYFPSTTKPISLKEHIELWNAFITAFPDLKHTVHESIAKGNFVVQRETLSGTHNGTFQGIPPTGKKIELSAICMWRFSNGKIVEYWADSDMLGMMQQLGMELQMKE